MSLSCGIVGLPNVGKSTIFNALTKAAAEAENFPFCTIDPNVGIVKVPDLRLEHINKSVNTQKIIPATMEFTDIAGLVKGASQGEGLGNKFLGNIRNTTAIIHVVRCFEDSNVVHVDGNVDPLRDVEVIDTELMLADLESVDKKLVNVAKLMKKDPKTAGKIKEVLDKAKAALEDGKTIRSMGLSEDEAEQVKDLMLLTQKKVLFVGNVLEEEIADPMQNANYKKLAEYAEKEGSEIVPICGKIEAEIGLLEEEEKQEFLAALNLEEDGLSRLIRKAYKLLGLATYFTAGEKEIRAWTIRDGYKAPQAAGVIHTDFERGFIKAEIYHYDDLMTYKTEAEVKAKGLVRMEGKEYLVKDGDIIHFRFNV